jgi:hypothetical protein
MYITRVIQQPNLVFFLHILKSNKGFFVRSLIESLREKYLNERGTENKTNHFPLELLQVMLISTGRHN